eukprot:TRINITY_DN320_c0_g1_i2.p1 TRINITY_DN320_c0_g1~~TRINITY_DN320_c0_g1_i2.p1  ORF type:complete len:177 (+),score=55.60 TRINITY_DN320_c0_g1_i2:34-531(+)
MADKKKERATKRLGKELKDIQTTKKPAFLVSTGLVDKDLFIWKFKVTGPATNTKGEESPYAKGSFELTFDMTGDYPFKPPAVKFITQVYHPNIKKDGSICENLLKEGWSPQTQIAEALHKVYNMLSNPDAEHPLDGQEEVAEQLLKKPKDFFKSAADITKKHASK